LGCSGLTENKFDSRQAKLDWNEDVVVNQQGDDDDDENSDKPAAPVKLEKKYSEKTVKTVNLLDERLIAYDLVRPVQASPLPAR
jgi:ATP-dependent RNA helicase DHX29